MDMENLMRQEFKTRIFEENIPRIKKCLALLDSKDLWKAPNANITSIGCTIQHLDGNVRQWIVAGLLSETDNRVRASEFEMNESMGHQELVDILDQLEKDLIQHLPFLNEMTLLEEKVIQGFQLTGFSAVIHVIEHFSYHTGQITLLTKLFIDQDLDYYGEHDLDMRN